MLPLILGGLASGLAGGLIGAAERSSANKQSLDLINQSISDLEAIGIPSVQAQQLVLEKYKSAGQLTPQMEDAIKQQNSEMQGISLSPETKEVQMNALAELQRIGDSGGMRLTDQAVAEGALGRIQAQERGSRDAITQDLREKGRYGSGDELAMKLANQQNAAQNANQVGLGLAGQAQQNALQSIMQAGQLGGNIRQQDYSQAADKARAQDAINQFNAQNSQNVAMRNAAAANNAQLWNLQNQQGILNANTGLSNSEQQYNKGLLQQQFNNQMQKQGAKSNARAGQATQIQNYGNQQGAMWGGIGDTLNKGLTDIAVNPKMFQSTTTDKPFDPNTDEIAAKRGWA